MNRHWGKIIFLLGASIIYVGLKLYTISTPSVDDDALPEQFASKILADNS